MAFRYALYVRRSTDEQTQSLEGQLDVLQPLARQRGLTVVKVLSESRSAKAPGRPVFNELMEMLRQGEADAILCWHLNRLTRNELDSGMLRWLLRSGVIKEIHTPDRIYRPEDNAFITAVESAAGEQFIVDLKNSSRRGTLVKVRNKGVPYKAPLGYRNDKNTRSVVPDPVYFPLLQQAWRLLLSGHYSIPSIHQLMTKQWGVTRPSTGKPVALSVVYSIFSNVFYTGFFKYEGEVYPGAYPPMVTRAEFERVQELLGKRTRPRKSRHDFAFRGLICCGKCGHLATPDRKRKRIARTGEVRSYVYYACAQGGKSCTRTSVREESIAEVVRSSLAQISLRPALYSFARDAVRRWRAEHEGIAESVRDHEEAARQSLTRKLDDLLTLRLDNTITNEEYVRKKEELVAQKEAIGRGEELAGEVERRSWESVENVVEFLFQARTAFERGDSHVKAVIARILAERFTLNSGEVSLEVKPMLRVVRARRKTFAREAASYEPLRNGSTILQAQCEVMSFTRWRPFLDDIRTAVITTGQIFPERNGW